jgi:hypothetical protein
LFFFICLFKDAILPFNPEMMMLVVLWTLTNCLIETSNLSLSAETLTNLASSEVLESDLSFSRVDWSLLIKLTSWFKIPWSILFDNFNYERISRMGLKEVEKDPKAAKDSWTSSIEEWIWAKTVFEVRVPNKDKALLQALMAWVRLASLWA